jgi:hypothetical protein
MASTRWGQSKAHDLCHAWGTGSDAVVFRMVDRVIRAREKAPMAEQYCAYIIVSLQDTFPRIQGFRIPALFSLSPHLWATGPNNLPLPYSGHPYAPPPAYLFPPYNVPGHQPSGHPPTPTSEETKPLTPLWDDADAQGHVAVRATDPRIARRKDEAKSQTDATAATTRESVTPRPASSYREDPPPHAAAAAPKASDRDSSRSPTYRREPDGRSAERQGDDHKVQPSDWPIPIPPLSF